VDVLLVEPNQGARRSLRRTIHETTPCVVVAEAADAKEALEALGTVRADVVVADIDLLRTDWAAVTRKVKRLYPYVHVLALTSRCDSKAAQRMQAAGAAGLVAKDRRNHQLTEALEATRAIGPDRRRAARPRSITTLWTAI
jgi:DNA-binding NarL/FixJ family response regulator